MNTAEPYSPIEVDLTSLPNPCLPTSDDGLGVRIAKWITRNLRFRAYYAIPPARLRVAAQLEARRVFPASAWREYPKDTEQFLQIVAEFIEWPNHHFVPLDPLGFALLAAYDEMPWWPLSAYIRRHREIAIDGQGIFGLAQNGGTMGEFVLAALTAGLMGTT